MAPADNPNPGNFANRPKEEVQSIASKGGQSSGGGFASMDPDKQVGHVAYMNWLVDANVPDSETSLRRVEKLRADRSSLDRRRQAKRARREARNKLMDSQRGESWQSGLRRYCRCQCNRWE